MLLYVLIFSFIGMAEKITNPLFPTPVEYSLSNLEPVSFSYYPTKEAELYRSYFQLRNDSGNHYFVYEELSKYPPDHMMQKLRNEWAQQGVRCAVTLSCKAKPFCTGKCKKMYYPMANFPDLSLDAPRDLCKISSFSCEKMPEGKRTASAEVLRQFKNGP